MDVTVRLSVNTTIVHDNSKIRLRGSVNATGNSNNFITLKLIDGIWFEQFRNY
jgi:hypothetical protein